MKLKGFVVGDRIDHPGCGRGTVTRVDADHIGIALDSGREALFDKRVLLRVSVGLNFGEEEA